MARVRGGTRRTERTESLLCSTPTKRAEGATSLSLDGFVNGSSRSSTFEDEFASSDHALYGELYVATAAAEALRPRDREA